MSKKQSIVFILAVVVGFFSTTMGCGPSGPKLYSIKGTATRNGKPLEKLYISFVPEDQNTKASATAVTDANGKFELEIGSTKGVYPGMHTVLVADPLAAVGGKSSDNPEYIAATKKFGMNSPLKLDIQKDESNLELKLD